MIAFILALALQEEIVKESDHELAPAAAVTVRTVIGQVRIRGTDKTAAHVRAVRRGRDRDLVEFRVEGEKNKLRIEAKLPERHRDLEVEIEIDVDVPRTVKSLGVDVVSGSIDVKDATGDSHFTTVSGPLNVDGLQGDLIASTISGNLRLARLSGIRASISVTSGSVEGAGELRDLDVTCVSGRASFDVTPKGDAWSVKASCVSGNLALRFPEATGARVDLKTMSGDLKCEFTLIDEKRNDRETVNRWLRGTIGSGSGTIRASTISGNVKLERIK